jgi:fluoroacetyl-CoA thioesterase
MGLRPGLSHTLDIVVDEQDTAAHVGSGAVHVLATPVVINMFESAALRAIEHLMPAGYQSLGTRLDVRHIAATPVGMKVSATARVTAVDGRKILFALEARGLGEREAAGPHAARVLGLEVLKSVLATDGRDDR